MADKKKDQEEDILTRGARVSLFFIFFSLLLGAIPGVGMIFGGYMAGKELGAFGDGKGKE